MKRSRHPDSDKTFFSSSEVTATEQGYSAIDSTTKDCCLSNLFSRIFASSKESRIALLSRSIFFLIACVVGL